MIKVFISQPMKGKSAEEIKLVRRILERIAQKKLNNEAEIIDSYFEDYPCAKSHKNIPLKFLAKSIDKLADADVFLLFQDSGAYHNRGCVIETTCAREYGLIMDYVDNQVVMEHATKEEAEELHRYFGIRYNDEPCGNFAKW